MIIREIESADVPAIFAVRIQTLENAISLERLAELGITEESILAAIKDTHKGWLCEVDGEVCGFAMGDRAACEVTVIALLPSHEGQGIGGQLLGSVEAWLAESGCEEIWLTTDVDTDLRAYGFYRRLGWEDWKIEDGDRFLRKRLRA